MKSKIYILAALLGTTFCGCITDSDQSVLEPLTGEQKAGLLDNGFNPYTFVLAEELANANLSASDRERFAEITYRDANAFLKTAEKWDSSEAESEWDKTYQSKMDSVPAILERYEKELEASLPENKHLEIIWEKASISDNGLMSNVGEVTFKVIPKTTVDEFWLSYGIVDKDNAKDVLAFCGLSSRNCIHESTPISSPKEYNDYLYYMQGEIDGNDFNNLTTAQLREKYHFEFYLTTRVNGKMYSKTHNMSILPLKVQLYIAKEKDGWEEGESEEYGKEVAEEYFGITIPDKKEFVKEKRNEYLKDFKPLVFEAFGKIMNEYNEYLNILE